MLRMQKVFLLCLLVSTLFPPVMQSSVAEAQNQDVYSLDLQGFVWPRSTLYVLVVMPLNASWWDLVYLNTTLRAIGQWNDAVSFFAANYSNYSYLSAVKLETTVSEDVRSGFNIYVNWTDSALSGTADEVGLSRITTGEGNSIVNCTITLAVKTNHGSSLGETDAQNIALHELGHSLGLGHSNYTRDLMYPVYVLDSSPRSVSTLDVYGVASIFGWLQNPADSLNSGLSENSVVLPATISYEPLPVSPQNMEPQTILDNPIFQVWLLMVELMLHPDVFLIMVVFIVIFVTIGSFPTKKRKPLSVDEAKVGS
ncbi:MAG: matrixin family metalloprotease [Candidatus Bathyarchaeota archaeon]|nr:matrixin family metalloprotease [Candidatus Bathyarchaeota archaeon]